MAVSIKTITARPFGKNLKNRFGDLCTEAITLHMRFPYSIVCALFAFPITADQDHSIVPRRRQISTFQRAMQLFGTISGRRDYTDPGEKFEDVTMMLLHPVLNDGSTPSAKLFDARTKEELSEELYFSRLLDLPTDEIRTLLSMHWKSHWKRMPIPMMKVLSNRLWLPRYGIGILSVHLPPISP